MKKLFRLTQSGIDELEQEKNNLIEQRAPLADRIKQARELGDLSENAEYQTAREEQNRAESRISEIEHILLNVELISKPKNDSKVQLGALVTLKGENSKEMKFQIVGTVEADPLEGKISDESPIGKALMGKKEGEEVEITTPQDVSTYKIVSIG